MEQRNMIMAFVLSMLVLVSWQALFPTEEAVDQQAGMSLEATAVPESGVAQPLQATSSVPDISLSSRAAPAPVEDAGNQALALLHNDVLILKLNAQGAIFQRLPRNITRRLSRDLRRCPFWILPLSAPYTSIPAFWVRLYPPLRSMRKPRPRMKLRCA